MITEKPNEAAIKPAHRAVSELAPANGYAACASRLVLLSRRLYPQQAGEWPEPEWMKDGINIDTHVELSFLDRLRVLASGRLRVTSRTATENALGKHTTLSVASPEPPMWMSERHIVGFCDGLEETK